MREKTFNVQLKYNVWHARTTPLNTEETVIDFGFPQGAYRQSQDDGRVFNLVTTFAVQYKAATSGTWLNAPLVNASGCQVTGTGTFTSTGNKSQSYRRAVKIDYPSAGQYDFRIRRTSINDQSTSFGPRWTTVDASYYTAIRHFEFERPVLKSDLALIAVRIKASDQLNGVIDSLNCTVEQWLPVWNGSTWTTQVTRNPAWAMVDVLTGPVGARPKSKATDLDLATLLSWATWCDTQGYTFDGALTHTVTIREFLGEICQTGRASPETIDGLYTVVVDDPKTTIVDHISPRIARDFEAVKIFADRPHKIHVRYPSDDSARGQTVEQIVYADGYNAGNATLYETLDLAWTREDNQAYKFARFALATQKLRPEVYTCVMGIGHIRFTRGDLVRVTYDVIQVGLGSGFIRSRTENGSSEVTTITIDIPQTMESGKSYAIRLRKAVSGATVSAVHQIDLDVATTATFTMTTPISGANEPEVGDLIQFGEYGSESSPMLVHSIAPKSDLSATITLIDEGADVHTADTGLIPAFDANMTLPPEVIRRNPGTPDIDGVDSTENALSAGPTGLVPGILISFTATVGATGVVGDYIQVQYKETDEDIWFPAGGNHAITAGSVLIPNLLEGETYNVRVRAATNDGHASPWREITETVSGFSGVPVDVESLLRNGSILTWIYPTLPLDFAGFELRRHFGSNVDWDSAVPLHVGVISVNSYDISMLPNGEQTLLLCAKDLAGNYSASPAILAIDIGDNIPVNILITQSEDPTFAGTKTNCTVVSNVLEADVDSSPLFWQTSGLFWGAGGAQFWEPSTYKQLVYEARYDPIADHVGATLTLDLSITGPYLVEYREELSQIFWPAVGTGTFWDPTGSNLFWPVSTYTSWAAWPGTLGPLIAGNNPVEIRITGSAGNIQTQITNFDILIDVPDVREDIADFVVASSGEVRLSLVNTYRDIVAVNLTVQDDGNSGVTARIIDKDDTLGPSIEVLDASGSRVTGLIDARIAGY